MRRALRVHALPVGGPSTYTVTETEFSPAAERSCEYAHITPSCEFNQINGSGTSGQCEGCASGSNSSGPRPKPNRPSQPSKRHPAQPRL